MPESIKADICIIGAGSGGLSVAAGAAQLGQKVVLIEKHKMGGDCLNTGCVPSKALIAAAHHAHAIRHAPEFGVFAGEPRVDYAKAMDHVHSVIAAIEPHDSVERFEKLGCQVILAEAKFLDPKTVEAGGTRIAARRFVVATGSRAFIPPIPGLTDTPFLTNESIFENRVAPTHLIIIGGGPIGLEMAHAHVRLGCKVTVVEGKTIMPKDDPELVAIVREAVVEDGVVLRENAMVTKTEKNGAGIAVTIKTGAGEETIQGSHLLLAAGRTPNVEGMGLENAGIKFSRKGIDVDANLLTTNRKVFAIGDVAGGYQFTHVAGYHAGLVIRRALFRVTAKNETRAIPWCTYTDPELAHVGLTEAQAKAQLGSVKVSRWNMAENDRAQAERVRRGLIKVVMDGSTRIVGASIVGPHAGDLILPWVMAVQQRMKIGAFTGIVAPYPTLGEVSKRVAGAYYTPTLFSGRTRTLVKLLSWFG
jgi:pyruvate/2-oxoglutarate dehydrogenase complex dihydrolipoamide dehydrogenase (E3) component